MMNSWADEAISSFMIPSYRILYFDYLDYELLMIIWDGYQWEGRRWGLLGPDIVWLLAALRLGRV